MKKVAACILVIASLAGYGPIEPQSAIAAPNVDIWTAAAQGNIEAIKQHLTAGTDLNAREVKKSGKAEIKSTGFKGSYYMNGEIHVNTYGTPEGKPLTSGYSDFKPSWSKTGDMLVFFRRLKNHRVTVMWKTAICIINVDGTGFHQLTDGTHGFQSNLDA